LPWSDLKGITVKKKEKPSGGGEEKNKNAKECPKTPHNTQQKKKNREKTELQGLLGNQKGTTNPAEEKGENAKVQTGKKFFGLGGGEARAKKNFLPQKGFFLKRGPDGSTGSNPNDTGAAPGHLNVPCPGEGGPYNLRICGPSRHAQQKATQLQGALIPAPKNTKKQITRRGD